MRPRALVIVDPFLVMPEIEAYNLILRVCGELQKSNECRIDCVQVYAAAHSQESADSFFARVDPVGVICFGSNANITERRPWAEALGVALRTHVFDKRIPFFGICFSHQLLGHLYGSKVDFLKKRHLYKNGKHRNYRHARVVHPKLRLLLAKIEVSDFHSGNKLDLDFKEALLHTSTWNAKNWETLMHYPEWKLTALEGRIRKFIFANTHDNFIAHARHEQEVHDVIPGQLELAATSDDCLVDALVHPELPIASVQPHPETHHELRLGERLLRNFVYSCDLIRAD